MKYCSVTGNTKVFFFLRWVSVDESFERRKNVKISDAPEFFVWNVSKCCRMFGEPNQTHFLTIKNK